MTTNNNYTTLNQLPQDVQDKVRNLLKVYNEANVVFENGRFIASSAVCIQKVYPADHKFIGVYCAKEVYTEDERIVNYIEQFHDFPINYTKPGRQRDYNLIRKLTWQSKIKLTDTGFEIIAE